MAGSRNADPWPVDARVRSGARYAASSWCRLSLSPYGWPALRPQQRCSSASQLKGGRGQRRGLHLYLRGG